MMTGTIDNPDCLATLTLAQGGMMTKPLTDTEKAWRQKSNGAKPGTKPPSVVDHTNGAKTTGATEKAKISKAEIKAIENAVDNVPPDAPVPVPADIKASDDDVGRAITKARKTRSKRVGRVRDEPVSEPVTEEPASAKPAPKPTPTSKPAQVKTQIATSDLASTLHAIEEKSAKLTPAGLADLLGGATKLLAKAERMIETGGETKLSPWQRFSQEHAAKMSFAEIGKLWKKSEDNPKNK